MSRKVNTNELTGAALDWAVAKCEDPTLTLEKFNREWERYNYAASIDWAQGGPIIEREGISLERITEALWESRITGTWMEDGPTPLIAAMRCYVGTKLGNEVEVPDELLEFA